MAVALGCRVLSSTLQTKDGQMLRSGLFRPFVVAFAALLVASCADTGLIAPKAATDNGAAQSHAELPPPAITGSVTDPTGFDLRAIWWKGDHAEVITVSKTIDQSGGTISIPETGLTVSFPVGAVASSITITITSDEKYVAYEMEPAGTRFLKDVTVTQQLNKTAIYGRPLQTQLYAAYIADDNLKLSGKVPVLEIEPSTTVFSPFSALLPQAEVWIIRHFSRYMLASG